MKIQPEDITPAGLQALLIEAVESHKGKVATPENLAAYREGRLEGKMREALEAIFELEPGLRAPVTEPVGMDGGATFRATQGLDWLVKDLKVNELLIGVTLGRETGRRSPGPTENATALTCRKVTGQSGEKAQVRVVTAQMCAPHTGLRLVIDGNPKSVCPLKELPIENNEFRWVASWLIPADELEGKVTLEMVPPENNL